MTLRPLQLHRRTPSAARTARLAVEALEARTVLSSTVAPASVALAQAAGPHVVSAAATGGATNLTGIQLTFNQAVKPSSLTAADLGLLGPAGRVSITGVQATDSTDRTFLVRFGAQTAPGTYTLYVGPDAVGPQGAHVAAYQAQFKVAAAARSPAPSESGAPHVVSATASPAGGNSLSGILLTFDRAISPSSLTAADLGLLGPAGRVSITGVQATDSTDRTFLVRFATQTTPGAYTLYVGTNATDLLGNRVAAYQAQLKVAAASAAPTPAPTSVLSFTSSTPTPVAAGGFGASLLAVNAGGTVGSLTVTVNITHPDDGELYIHLQAPDGTDVVLSDRLGGSAANFVNVTFADGASRSIAFSGGPFSGAYQPLKPLSVLDGKSMQGTWKLWVEDFGTHAGTINSWSLTMTPA
jgi:subtilisin-like proprotein convertase family protein